MKTKVAHNKKGTPGYFEWLRKCRQTRRMRELDEMMEAQYLVRYQCQTVTIKYMKRDKETSYYTFDTTSKFEHEEAATV